MLQMGLGGSYFPSQTCPHRQCMRLWLSQITVPLCEAFSGASSSPSASTSSSCTSQLQHFDGKTAQLAHEEGRNPCERAASQNEWDETTVLLHEVLVEVSTPDKAEKLEGRRRVGRRVGKVVGLVCRLFRWPVRLLWGAVKGARKVFRAVFRH
jgi:hypothetical protein